MWNRRQMMVMVFAGAALQLSASPAMSAPESDEPGKKARPSKVEAIDGSKVKRVTLIEKAAQRLDIQTGEVGNEAGRLTTPYSSVLYDTGGGVWVYTVPTPLTYVRQSVVVEAIKGEKAYLKQGATGGDQGGDRRHGGVIRD